MSPEDEKYYETYFDLFITDGWKQFVEEIKAILESHRIEDLKTIEELSYIKGERAILTNIANFELNIRNGYDYISEAENAEEV